MGKIYLPEGVDGVCYVPSTDYITVLETNYNNQHNNGYRVYLNDYRVVPVTSYSQQNCDTYNTYTHDIWFRNDLPQLFFLITIIIIFIYFMFKIFLFPFFVHLRRY